GEQVRAAYEAGLVDAEALRTQVRTVLGVDPATGGIPTEYQAGPNSWWERFGTIGAWGFRYARDRRGDDTNSGLGAGLERWRPVGLDPESLAAFTARRSPVRWNPPTSEETLSQLAEMVEAARARGDEIGSLTLTRFAEAFGASMRQIG